MVKVKENLSGKTFGRLKVLYQAEDYISPKGKHTPVWHCVCSCDEHNEIDVKQVHLKTGNTKSCGCLKKEKTKITGNHRKKYNKYDLSGDYGIGWTSNTNSEFYFDLEDYDLIKDYCWCEEVQKDGYHCLKSTDRNNSKKIKFHYLLGYKNYDHINKNPLDNRKNNLRFATISQNQCNKNLRKNNTSGVTGVSWDKRSKKWIAYINIENEHKRLGHYTLINDAIIARLQAEKKYYKEFAPQQHLYDKYKIE